MLRNATLLACVLSLAATALPAAAQTSDVWTNTKISDLRRHQQEVSAPAAEKLDMANRHLVRIDQLTQEEKELSPRQEKKLRKAYDKAVEHLEEAIGLEPEWLEPRLYLASVHYRMEEYDEAVRCYEEALELEPENEQVQGYLESARWYAERAEKGDGEGEAEGS